MIIYNITKNKEFVDKRCISVLDDRSPNFYAWWADCREVEYSDIILIGNEFFIGEYNNGVNERRCRRVHPLEAIEHLEEQRNCYE